MRRLACDRGSATVEFTLVAALLALVVASVIQLSIALYVRNVVVDACAEGARHGALLGGDADSGLERTRTLIATAVGDSYADAVTARFDDVGGIEVLVIRAEAPIPVVGLVGIGSIEAEGHGVLETLE